MIPSNLLVLQRARVVQFLIVAMLMILSLGTFGFPSRAQAASAPTDVSSLTPSLSGPLVATSLFQHDIENASRHYSNATTTLDSHNYMRLTEYAWGLDPLEETDSSRDYYIVFVSAAIQANGNYYDQADGNYHSWCLYNHLGYGSQNVTIRADTGTILSNGISPVNTQYGTPIASLGFNLGLTLGGGEGSPGGVSAGISWSQTVFDWTTAVVSLNSTEVSWRTTISPGFIHGVGDCNTSAWVWGYATAISVGEGQTPSVEVSLTGTFYVPDSTCNSPGFWDIIRDPL